MYNNPVTVSFGCHTNHSGRTCGRAGNHAEAHALLSGRFDRNFIRSIQGRSNRSVGLFFMAKRDDAEGSGERSFGPLQIAQVRTDPKDPATRFCDLNA
jgi:hypothetical protein